MVIGEGLLAREYINAVYDMLTAYDFLLEDAFSTPISIWEREIQW